MMALAKLKICESEFRRLYARKELSRTDLACHFGCSVSTIDGLRVQFGLPKRKTCRWRRRQVEVDPTPEEIEVRKAECRARHMAQRRNEPDSGNCLEWRQAQKLAARA
jgi:hypothetical protein